MEIISIEGRTYEAIMERFEQIVRKVDALCEQGGGKELKKWLDGQDVCAILNISKRTLQSLRDSGKLSYTQINRMMYYKPEDVERLINDISEGKEVRRER
ncbi:helix-turn-helix domain-containing protein [Phocaeicola plebeius]|uniref:DNA-binding protein n=1 Tax=Phocaeicola plebeius TaxID=310297 RepID=A0A414FS18_9BACT|nr:helix-turn-helix domain-containing protein [Phocaeicola plebeius]RHD53439.1 DNA-binding protein [Phocaeicola plebeius]